MHKLEQADRERECGSRGTGGKTESGGGASGGLFRGTSLGMHRGISGRAASHYVRTSVFLHTERRKTWRPDKGTLGGPAGEQQVHHLELSPDGVPECAEDEGKPFGR